jgi:hypothetical protein
MLRKGRNDIRRTKESRKSVTGRSGNPKSIIIITITIIIICDLISIANALYILFINNTKIRGFFKLFIFSQTIGTPTCFDLSLDHLQGVVLHNLRIFKT